MTGSVNSTLSIDCNAELNIVCVLWGTYYSVEYVSNLYQMVKKNCTLTFKFHVFTDQNLNHPEWVIHSLPQWDLPQSKAWWYKISIFDASHGLTGKTLFLDLDVVVTSNIDMFFDLTDRFAICQDFNRVYLENFRSPNSSVMCFDPSKFASVYDEFITNKDYYIGKFRGDQDYLKYFLTDYVFFPKEWVMSYRWEIWKGGIDSSRSYRHSSDCEVIHPDCKIVAFHGVPKPHELAESSKLWSLWKA